VLTQVMAAKPRAQPSRPHVVGHAMKNCMIPDDPSITRDEGHRRSD